MKAYFIFSESSLRENKLLPLLSAFVTVEAAGSASDLLEAIDIIRQKHPGAFIFDSSILDNSGGPFTPPPDDSGPLVILPRNYRIREACAYAGVSFEFKEYHAYNWLMRSVASMITQYQGEGAR